MFQRCVSDYTQVIHGDPLTPGSGEQISFLLMTIPPAVHGSAYKRNYIDPILCFPHDIYPVLLTLLSFYP